MGCSNWERDEEEDAGSVKFLGPLGSFEQNWFGLAEDVREMGFLVVGGLG